MINNFYRRWMMVCNLFEDIKLCSKLKFLLECLFLSIQSLMINSSARRTCTVGEIVNLVSADTQKLMDFVVYFNAVWLAPIEIALCLFFLWQVCWNAMFSQWLPFIQFSSTMPWQLFFFLFFSPPAFRPVCFGRNRHCHSHFPTQRIHCKEKEQAPGKKAGILPL